MDASEAVYDSIWPCIYGNPTFYGKKDGKVAIINFDTHEYQFYESPAQFDEVKTWSTVHYVARMGNTWYRVNNFGFYIPSERKARTTIDLEPLVTDVDDISREDDADLYYFRKNDLVGIMFKVDGKWMRTPAQFKSVKKRDYWFNHDYLERAYYLFDVTMADGKKGPVNAKGTFLFK